MVARKWRFSTSHLHRTASMKQRGFLTYNTDGNIRTPGGNPVRSEVGTVITVKSAAPLGLCAIVIGLAVVSEPAPASADVCASVGRRVSVSGCGSIADAVAPWVPPPAYYAPLPEDYAAPPPPPPPPPLPNVNVCANFGRRINVSGCV